jgi:hypothetical protein
MKSPAPIVGILAPSLAAAVAMLLACDCSAGEPVVKWRADPFLVWNQSSTNCGHNFKEAIKIEFDGEVMKTSGWTGTTYDIHLLEPLHADGSGKVSAVSMPANRSLVIKFDPGHGPRPVRYWARYNARCIWKFIPIEG